MLKLYLALLLGLSCSSIVSALAFPVSTLVERPKAIAGGCAEPYPGCTRQSSSADGAFFTGGMKCTFETFTSRVTCCPLDRLGASRSETCLTHWSGKLIWEPKDSPEALLPVHPRLEYMKVLKARDASSVTNLGAKGHRDMITAVCIIFVVSPAICLGIKHYMEYVNPRSRYYKGDWRTKFMENPDIYEELDRWGQDHSVITLPTKTVTRF